MRKPLIVLLAASLLLAGCGGWSDARVNPRNWFGNSRTVAVVPTDPEAVNPLIPARSRLFQRAEAVDNSVTVAAVTEMRIDPTSIGAIILVTGISNRQGAFDAELRLDPEDEGTTSDVLSYTFRVVYPSFQTTVGSEFSRTIRVAQSVTHQDLRGVRLIRVKAAQNTVESRRR